MRTDFIEKTDGTDKDYYLMVIDENGFIQFANSHFISNLDIKPAKIHEKSFFQFLGAKHLKSFKESVSIVKQNNTPVSIDIPVHNGSIHWMKFEISKYTKGNNGTDKFFCVGYDIVGKETVKKMKKVANRNYEAIMDGLTIGVIMQDAKGDVLAVNQKAAEIFNVSIESLYENIEFRKLWNNILNDSGPLSYERSPSKLALDTKELQKDVRVTFKTEESVLKTLLIDSQPLFEENDPVPAYVVTSITDISRENNLEIELEQQDLMFQTFHNNSPNLAWVVDQDGRLCFVNNAFSSFLRLGEDIIGKNILNIIPDSVALYLEKVNKQVLTTGISFKAREKYTQIDGTELIFWISVFPIESKLEGSLLGGEAIDITNHVFAQKELQQSNERFSNFSTLTKDAIWEWDMLTGEIYRNQKLQDITGYSVSNSHTLGWWFKRIHQDDRRRIRDTIKNVIENKMQSWESEYKFKKETGEYISVYDRGFLIYENGLPVKMISSLSDVTKVKELEEKLVAEKVQRLKDITETVFSVQEKERTRIGHELHDNVNQILSTCKLFMDMFKSASPEDEELKVKVKEYILTAIEEIRKLSKEMVTPQLKENGLIASIKTLVDDLQATDVMNVFFYNQEEVEVISNGKKVTFFRILQEQIKNILKYSKAKNVTIHLHPNGDDIQLVIEDDGIGFDPKQSRRGIGLSNIYERTRFYNGKLQIKTSLGQGCKMIVDIPAYN